MSIALQQETLYDIAHEVDALLQMHYEELCLNKDRVKLSPMWEKYAALEQAGCFVVFTARNDGELIGYSAFFIQPHLHYSSLVVASNDVLFIRPDQRGSTGLRLVKFSEQQIAAMKKDGGELKIVWRAKLNTALESLLPKLGYATEEVSFGKIL